MEDRRSPRLALLRARCPGSLTNIEQSSFVQKVVIWLLGAGVISYGHSLAHSTQRNWQGKENFKDLSEKAQCGAMAVHGVWFALFVAAALWL